MRGENVGLNLQCQINLKQIFRKNNFFAIDQTEIIKK